VLNDVLRRLDAGARNGHSAFARWRREALMHKSSIAHLDQRRREGVNAAVDDQQRQRVIAAVLELIDTLEQRAKDAPIWSEAPLVVAGSPNAAPAQAVPSMAPLDTADEAIFVSYKREDRRQIEPLIDIIAAQGWTVFWDPKIVPGSPNWDMLLERKLMAAKCVLVAWSAAAATSHYVRTEAHHGRSCNTLVAVTFDGTVPATFALAQTVDLTSWSGRADDPRIAGLLEGIGRMLER
jgi:TIR domain